jgi:hypothetical protein
MSTAIGRALQQEALNSQALSGAQLSVLAGVVKRNLSVFAGLQTINQAAVERARVDVQAYGALVELSEVQHLMHGFGGIYFRGHEPMYVQ